MVVFNVVILKYISVSSHMVCRKLVLLAWYPMLANSRRCFRLALGDVGIGLLQLTAAEV